MVRNRSRRAPRALPARVRLAGAALAATAAALAATVPAPPASAAAAGVSYSLTGSGYQVTGRWFHYIKTVVQLPDNALCAKLYQVVHVTQFSVSVELDSSASSAVLIIADSPTSTGCRKYSATFVNGGTSTPVPPPFAMSPGDRIKMYVFYAQNSPLSGGQHSVSGHLENLTTGAGAVVGDLALNTYTQAQVLGGFGSFAAPPAQFRAFEFTHCAAETYSGDRSTLTGPWTTTQVVMTSNGQSTGTVEASSPVLWDGGRNFGTWVRAAAAG
jgi:hypothetical protein